MSVIQEHTTGLSGQKNVYSLNELMCRFCHTVDKKLMAGIMHEC